jgi:hypothetical protein
MFIAYQFAKHFMWNTSFNHNTNYMSYVLLFLFHEEIKTQKD